MKKVLAIGLIILLAIGASYIVYASNVANTKHNLSTSAGPSRTYYLTAGTNGDEVCVFCHTPHGGDQSQGPLWNRDYSPPSFNMYSSSTINMTMDAQPQTVSLACLSCHDGTTAFDALLNFPGSGSTNPGDWTWANGYNTIQSSSTAYMGTDLTNDHPISILYDTDKDNDFIPKNASNVNGLPLYNGKVECGSCHNPHDNTNGLFLRASNAGSALCTKCHTK
jgi:predicted CXXCH cytochrome family protein